MVKSFEIARPLPRALADEVTRSIHMRGGKGATGAAGTIRAANASGRSLADRLQMGLACISLAADTSVLTAIANDIGSDALFAQQVVALGRRGDVLWCISTSGNSESVVNAAVVGRTLGMKVIGLTGRDGGVLAPSCDVALRVPSVSTAEIQQMHVCVYHHICREVERRLMAQAWRGDVP
jgi:D-sedoheptulose 7-phosphate isomerase